MVEEICNCVHGSEFVRGDRPKCASIYRHGRLKTMKEMIADGTAKPLPDTLVDRVKKITLDVEVDLDAPLPEDKDSEN